MLTLGTQKRIIEPKFVSAFIAHPGVSLSPGLMCMSEWQQVLVTLVLGLTK